MTSLAAFVVAMVQLCYCMMVMATMRLSNGDNKQDDECVSRWYKRWGDNETKAIAQWDDDKDYIRNIKLFNLNHSFITIIFTDLMAIV